MKFLLAFGVVFAISMANGAWIFARLESQHSELWNSLGQPSLGGSNVGHARLNFMRWVWSLKFRGTEDRPLRLACAAALAMEAALLLLALAAWGAL